MGKFNTRVRDGIDTRGIRLDIYSKSDGKVYDVEIQTTKNICCEDNNLRLNDGAVTIFLNAKGRIDDISPELKAFLDLIMGRSSDDPFVMEIEKHLEFAKHNSEWRRSYMMMTIWEQGKILEGMDRGMAKGIAIGEKRGDNKARRSMAIQMNNEGLPLDMIARITQESPKVIQSWIDEESEV